jgi:hypothetical protein
MANNERQRQDPCHFQLITHRGACGKARVVPHNRRPGSELRKWVIRRCVLLLSAHDWRGGGRNEMRTCQTLGPAESVMPQVLSAVAVQRSTVTLEASR